MGMSLVAQIAAISNHCDLVKARIAAIWRVGWMFLKVVGERGVLVSSTQYRSPSNEFDWAQKNHLASLQIDIEQTSTPQALIPY